MISFLSRQHVGCASHVPASREMTRSLENPVQPPADESRRLGLLLVLIGLALVIFATGGVIYLVTTSRVRWLSN